MAEDVVPEAPRTSAGTVPPAANAEEASIPVDATEGLEPDELSPEPQVELPEGELLKLEEALQRIPESLRREMKDLLKAEFHQVQRWKPGAS